MSVVCQSCSRLHRDLTAVAPTFVCDCGHPLLQTGMAGVVLAANKATAAFMQFGQAITDCSAAYVEALKAAGLSG